MWASFAPLAILAALLVHPGAIFLLLLYPAQIARLALRDGGSAFAWGDAALMTLGKFPEALGVLGYHFNRMTGAKARLIEYKS